MDEPMDVSVGQSDVFQYPEDGHFDWEAYVNQYTGHTRHMRMEFIAERLPEKASLSILKQIHDEIRHAEDRVRGQGVDLVTYMRVVDKIGGRLSSKYALDESWVQMVTKSSEKRCEDLERDLNNHKTNLIRESIRIGHNDLGDFHYLKGDLMEAFKCYSRARDYCSRPVHIIDLSFKMIRLGFEFNNLNYVMNYVQKIEQVGEAPPKDTQSKTFAIQGLLEMKKSKFKSAAKYFLKASSMGDGKADIISQQDIATYGSICALATLDRADLCNRLLQSESFAPILELVPQIREMARSFHSSQYTESLSILEKIRIDCMLDIHLHDKIGVLCDMIRQRALVQYTLPYISIDLGKMAMAFSVSTTKLERELADLIMGNKISARIDSKEKVLYARHADQRKITFASACKAADEYIRNLRVMILRANMIRAEFMIKGEGAGWSGTGGSGNASGGVGNSGGGGGGGMAAESAHGQMSQESRDNGAFAPRVPLRT